MERVKLITARERKHWTLQEAARRIEINYNTLYRWEKGLSTPRGYNVQRLCEVYEATTWELGLEDDGSTTTIAENRQSVPEETHPFLQADLTMRLLVFAFIPHRSYQDKQDKMTRLIEEYDAMNTDHDAVVTRRDALRRLAAFPLVTLKLNATQPMLHRPPEEILTQCAASIVACWELSKGNDDGDLSLAFKGASAYLPTLEAIVMNSSQHRKEAASLAGQCALLKTMLGWHLEGLKEAAIYAREAITYAREADDISLLLSALDYLAWAEYYDKRGKQALHNIEQAVPLLMQSKKRGLPLSTRLQGGVYSTLALMQAKNGQNRIASLRQAANAFFAPPVDESRFVYMDYTTSDLVLNDGMVHYHQGDYAKALDSLSQLIDPETLALKMPLPERSRIEGLNMMTLASLKAKKKDMEHALHIWTEAINGAKTLQSEQRFSEALTGYEIMEALWSDEKRITNLRDHIIHW
jgi:transcriptional regulator with XRE-family HTH domain/tetratricopeptide (TPR) repeat protein